MLIRKFLDVLPNGLRLKLFQIRASLRSDEKKPKDVIYFKNKRVIYIHIPKAAGISLFKSVFGRDSFGHRSLIYYKKNMTKKEFCESFKFTFVRDPYDRIHSAYHYLKKGGRGRPYDVMYEKVVRNYPTFESFVMNWVAKGHVDSIEHFCPQISYLLDEKGMLKFDFIGRFENMQEDFKRLKEHVSIDSNLEVINKAKSNKPSFSDEYTSEMIEVVNRIYEKDFFFLNYEKLE